MIDRSSELDRVELGEDPSERGFEFKCSSAPVLTPSMRIAVRDLRLDSLEVIHAGSETYRLSDRVRAVLLARIGTDIEPLDPSPPSGSRPARGTTP